MTLELKNVSKSYGTNKALNNVSYTFNKGIYALLGPNGAGKTTLMNILTMNLKADSGEICWNGQQIGRDRDEYIGIVGYMPQQQSVYRSLSLERFMYYMASLKGISKADAKAQIESLLQKVELWDVRKKHLSAFSGGMKQRALLAQSMLGNPELLILDEPTAGLDPLQRVSVRKMIKEASENKIVLISTHVLSDVEGIADEVLLMKKGEILENNLKEKYKQDESLEDFYVRIFGSND